MPVSAMRTDTYIFRAGPTPAPPRLSLPPAQPSNSALCTGMDAEEDDESWATTLATTTPTPVRRRTRRACEPCRAAKIRCSGTKPCDRCTRRRDSCTFASDEPQVSVPERYLLELQRRVAAAEQSNIGTSTDQSRTSPSLMQSVQSPYYLRRVHTDEQPQQEPHSLSTDQYEYRQQQRHQPPQQQHPSQPTANSTHRLDILASTASNAAGANNAPNPNAPTPVPQLTNSNIPLPHNPLVARNLAYIRDSGGRPRYLGPTSTWSFCRRALSLLEGVTPPSDGFTSPLNLDGAAFRLHWRTKAELEPSDLKGLPAIDYAQYLYNTFKFRLGELFSIVNETSFLANLAQFNKNPWETAQANRLWFTEYLLIIAYGKAFLSSSGRATSSVPGSEFAARATALLPDVAQIHEEQMLGIEVLTLLALYFQSIDMRSVAYQYIGQALRLSYIEGIHCEVPNDVVSTEYANRCNSTWWIVFVLDQELTALMGGPPSVPEDVVTVALPSERSESLSSKTLTLRIRLSRLLATMCSTVYGQDKGLGTTFIRSTTAFLHQLAEVSRELDDAVSDFKAASESEPPHMIRHVTLSYHNCIVLATRPLVMWLLVLSVPTSTVEPQQLDGPISKLLHTSVESALAILSTLKKLAEHDMLETFLPFQLEYAFSSAMLLSILAAIMPEYVPENSWRRAMTVVLDEMLQKKNVVATLRKSEWEQLDALLDPVRRNEQPRLAADPGLEGPVTGGNPEEESIVAPASNASNEQVSVAQADVFDTNSFGLVWGMSSPGNPFTTNPDQMFELAAQFEMGDLPMDFLFENDI